MVMHDVLWPYGRRDLYYTPERIPEEFRQPYRAGGIVPGRSELGPPGSGGLNPHLANAEAEGGPRNGVMTALDDFLAEHDRPVRRLVLPLYFGLAIVAEEALLDAQPALRELLDEIEGADRRLELIELGESIRVREQVDHHNVYFGGQARNERGAKRYLQLLKAALLDEHHIENEVRIDHLLSCIAFEAAPSPHQLGDPRRFRGDDVEHLLRMRRTGELAGDRPNVPGSDVPFAATTIGRNRLDQLDGCLDAIRTEFVEGDLVDCCVGRGGSAVFLRAYLDAYEMGVPKVWVADRFGGYQGPADDDDESGAGDDAGLRFPPDINMVREVFHRFDLLDDRVRFLQGALADTLTESPITKVALLRVDGSNPDDVRAALDALYGKVTLGGFVVIDDYADPACQVVVDEFRAEIGVVDKLERIDHSAAAWRKTTHGEVAEPRVEPSGARAPSVRPAPADSKSLSVVVVFYNMRREAARTLHSLTRAYQEHTGHIDYEVIVVENGSAPDQRLGAEYVESFGPEFRYIDLGDEARVSPAYALNRGIAAAVGTNVALMIDGAHVLTPGVLRYGILGLATYRPAVVTTQQWYVGPGQQNEAVAAGYDQEFEDKLFGEIEWPSDGYRLFHVGHFIGDRDWFEGQWESNCLFVPRSLLEQTGGFDESFDIPGGAFANLDLFERMASTPGVRLVTMLGEGSFHQVHGGTTTNVGEVAERAGIIRSYYDHYEQVRGRPFHIPAKPFHYVGTLPVPARRTKARRMGAPVFFSRAHVDGTDGRPLKPLPVPDELRTEFVDAFWRSNTWHQTTWLGKWVAKPPTDLLTYQELVHRVRPGWIIETGTSGGGRALFLATICDLVGTGQIVSIDTPQVPTLPEHPRLTFLDADPNDDATAEQVAAIVGENPRALVILGKAGSSKMLRSFEHYSPHVPVGSYVVVEDTIVNGHPVWAGFGSGPAEAVKEIINRGGFTIDSALERYALTFNPGGFLKRTS